MYAVIETGGKQYTVKEGDFVSVEKLNAEAGEKVVFDRVLMISGEGDTKVGSPIVEQAKVEAEVVEQGKAKKVIVFKFKPKKGFSKKNGHRQPFTKVRIDKIVG
ncbi:MAG: 50S ribosomal protein L21 [Tissierellia bacterium]|nr:50S ribosomal protein L21 [Tissierellia bacterium]